MKRIFALTIIAINATLAYSTPQWMWIGVYEPWLHSIPCSGYDLLPYDLGGGCFFPGAYTNHPDGPAPEFAVYDTGTYCTQSSLSPSYNRDFNDFIFVYAHGSFGGISCWKNDLSYCKWLYLGNGMNLGSQAYGGTRWAVFYSCNTLEYICNQYICPFWSVWDSAFKGVQCVLGFGSDVDVYDGGQGNPDNAGPQLTQFWQDWTSTKSMADAWIDSNRHWYYEVFDYDITPAIISSYSPSDSHFYLDDSYSTATSEQAVNGAWVNQYREYK
jgi:hypothetical protein